ncbi:MAG: hypothetical protein KDC49_17600 [Saprospiraceae bacterium]|nr:hypothetical protein [Saprospiraceae bacterium]
MKIIGFYRDHVLKDWDGGIKDVYTVLVQIRSPSSVHFIITTFNDLSKKTEQPV